MKVFYLLSGFISLLLLVSSCLKDDLSGCGDPVGPGEARLFNLYFSYVPLSYASRGFDPAEVEEICLFIFDENGMYVGQEIDESPDLSSDYYIPVSIVPGIYDFIVWGNVYDCYRIFPEKLIEQETTKEEFLLLFETGSNGQVNQVPHPLFFGSLEKTKILEKDGQRFTVPLVKNTYKINVSTTGLEVSGDAYSLEITDRGNSYKFDNTYASNTEVQYITPCRVNSSGQPNGSLTVQRLIESRTYGRLRLTDHTLGEVLYDENLIEMLLLLRQAGVSVDFARTYEYDIELDFKPVPVPGAGTTHILVSIQINGWTIILDDYKIK